MTNIEDDRPAPKKNKRPKFSIVVSMLFLSRLKHSDANCTLCSEFLPTKKLDIEWPVSINNTCSELHLYASSLSSSAQECVDAQSISSLCGCTVSDRFCNLCEYGNVTQPTKKLDFLATEFNGVSPTCELFEAYVRSFNVSSHKCRDSMTIGPTCGCSLPSSGSCNFCEHGGSLDPNETVPQSFGDELYAFSSLEVDFYSCDLVNGVLGIAHMEKSDCQGFQDYSYLCGCESSRTADRRRKLLAWIPRISAPLSFFGSAFIIYDVIRKKKWDTKHLLLLAMSVVDCMYSTAWALSTLPIPEYEEDGSPTNVYGSRGNEKTCTAQGFFIQFGFASPFYNVSLALYYMLVISYGWSEDHIKKLRIPFFVFPFVIGLALALAAIPYYGPSDAMCYISGRDDDPDFFYALIVIFMIIPLGMTMFVALIIMIKIYLKVYFQHRVAQRWIMTRRSNVESLPRKVFWQCFWYLMSFYISWPIIFVVPFVNATILNNFWFLCLAMFLAPIQGFFNYINYSRLKWLRYCNTRFRKHHDASQSGTANVTLHAEPEGNPGA